MTKSVYLLVAALAVLGTALAWDNIEANAKCPECELTIPELIRSWGYPLEQHIVAVPDGFKLTMFRIPGPRNASIFANVVPRPVVLLQHGLLDSCATWVENLPRQSLAYILADAGFDVWLGNNRGNHFSEPDCNTEKCWAFSFDEMALFDLPGMIDYVLGVTKQPSLTYVGHSEGSTQAFASFSIFPQMSQKVNLFIALAPATKLRHQTSRLIELLAGLRLDEAYAEFGFKKFLPTSRLIADIADAFCNGGAFTSVCENILFSLIGTSDQVGRNLNSSRLPLILHHTPAGTSTMNMIHWAQLVRSDKFQMFDYGDRGNYIHYGQRNAPVYDLSAIKLPVAVFHGGRDFLGDPVDVEDMMNDLVNLVYSKSLQEYNHLDFVWGLDAHEILYPDVVTLCQKYAAHVV